MTYADRVRAEAYREPPRWAAGEEIVAAAPARVASKSKPVKERKRVYLRAPNEGDKPMRRRRGSRLIDYAELPRQYFDRELLGLLALAKGAGGQSFVVVSW